MKKILCYVAIVLLLILIILPPMLRIFVKEEAYEPPKDVVSLLNCNKDDESISMPYLNGGLVSIKYTFPALISSPDIYVREDDFDNNLGDILEVPDTNLTLTPNESKTLKSVLEGITNTQSETVNNLTIYTLDMKDTNNSSLVPNEFKGSSDVMKNYYTNLGYTCNIIE